MPRNPTADQLDLRIKELVAALGTARQVLPGFLEQARLELHELTGRLPQTAGCDRERCDGTPHAGWPHRHPARLEKDPPPYYSDPTGERVVNFRPVRDGNCDPTQDLERYTVWLGDLQKLLGSTRRLLNNAPAATLAVVKGRRPTDGRSQEEHEQRRFVHALTDNRCLIDQDHDTDDRFGPGQLRRGLCDRHRKAYGRWVEDNSEQLFGMDGGERLVCWQKVTFGKVAGATEETDTPAGDTSPYKTLREVA